MKKFIVEDKKTGEISTRRGRSGVSIGRALDPEKVKKIRAGLHLRKTDENGVVQVPELSSLQSGNTCAPNTYRKVKHRGRNTVSGVPIK
ncbi:hypothetical protein COU17_01440 [Candidatus Kaiserbacteria bacterium CG10_big_fil_rev_8_21_14_0_10_49_17]|uniref:Uncharacterized protein n=1 Tax=Candidatus Kaiserbacteria bacterium CG10_big_fil_rev_8_21_14_0_10_49_17 TaxID=1974609 RepID=A0A2M6WES5_9BACT|nr:MAG: hypothetical protein COU17_01440 [Candidatus Kaiserbacteria bacterium CG10_big_fil_rev_8_21_14_0_10_49_17]